MRKTVFLGCLAAFAAAAPQANAADRLGIRPGMTLEAASAALRSRCPDLAVEGDTEKYLTCWVGAGTVIEATASPAGRVYYVSWREPATEADVLAYTARIAGELGFSGKGKDCKFYDYELRCWTGKDGTVLYSGERDGERRFVSYLINESIESEDMGAPTAAPVSRDADDGSDGEIADPSQ